MLLQAAYRAHGQEDLFQLSASGSVQYECTHRKIIYIQDSVSSFTRLFLQSEGLNEHLDRIHKKMSESRIYFLSFSTLLLIMHEQIK